MNSNTVRAVSLEQETANFRLYETRGQSSRVITLFSNWWSLFLRQELPSFWDPRPSVFRFVLFFAVLAFLTVPMASIILWQSLENTEIVIRYDSFKTESNQELNNSQREQILLNYSDYGVVLRQSLIVPENLGSPVYVYYELKDFYQNHKRYVRSAQFDQIGKGNISSSQLSVCDPYKLIPVNESLLEEERRSTDERVINPCGLVAHSYFNDTFSLHSASDRDGVSLELRMKETGIATEWDRKYLYGDHDSQNFNDDPATRGGSEINGSLNEDEHFMVWMKVGSRPTVRKLYGIIEEDIPKGANLTFEIQNRYNTYKFGGEKRLILSTTNWTGGRDIFTGVLYFVIGGMSALACLVILLLDKKVDRQPGDIQALSWNRKNK